MTMTTRALSLVSALLALAACNPPTAEEPAAPSEPALAATPTPAPPAAPPVVELPAVPAGAKVFFIAPIDGAKIEGPLENGKISVKVQMGAENIAVKPAGPVEAGSGHHHLLIGPPSVAAGEVVPKDETRLHFGLGQTEATIALAPGEHMLQLQFADGLHRSYGAPLMAAIKITTVAAGSVQAAPAAESPTKK